MNRYDRITPLVAYGILMVFGLIGFLSGHPDAATYTTGAFVVMALRNRE